MRLIDADALKKEIERIFFLLPTPEDEFCIEVVNCYLNTIAQRIENVIENMPTIDAEPVRHGRWKRVRFFKTNDPDGGFWIVRCSNCSVPRNKKYTYCPSCGAKMDGGKEE